MKVKESISLTFIFQLSIFLSCCVERITFGYLFESKYACLVQFYIHFFAVGKVHDNFVVTCELQQFGRFAVCFYAPALVCFIENQIYRFFFSFFLDVVAVFLGFGGKRAVFGLDCFYRTGICNRVASAPEFNRV